MFGFCLVNKKLNTFLFFFFSVAKLLYMVNNNYKNKKKEQRKSQVHFMRASERWDFIEKFKKGKWLLLIFSTWFTLRFFFLAYLTTSFWRINFFFFFTLRISILEFLSIYELYFLYNIKYRLESLTSIER